MHEKSFFGQQGHLPHGSCPNSTPTNTAPLVGCARQGTPPSGVLHPHGLLHLQQDRICVQPLLVVVVQFITVFGPPITADNEQAAVNPDAVGVAVGVGGPKLYFNVRTLKYFFCRITIIGDASSKTINLCTKVS